MPPALPTFDDVLDTSRRLDGQAHRTPVLTSGTADEPVRAEVRAHVELTKRGRTRAYKAAERASELAFKAAFERGCAWTRRSR